MHACMHGWMDEWMGGQIAQMLLPKSPKYQDFIPTPNVPQDKLLFLVVIMSEAENAQLLAYIYFHFITPGFPRMSMTDVIFKLVIVAYQTESQISKVWKIKMKETIPPLSF